MRDKAVEEVTGILFPMAARIIATAPNNPRALRPEVIAEQSPGARVAASVREAIELAKAGAAADDLIVITGSLFVVGEASMVLVQ